MLKWRWKLKKSQIFKLFSCPDNAVIEFTLKVQQKYAVH